MAKAPNASPVATKALPRPRVATLESWRPATVATCTAVAAAPPASTARVQRRSGFVSVTTEAVTRMPATIAVGVAIVSRRLSIQGT